MDLALEGKVAIVTGASRGIGRAIALRLAQERMAVVVAARNAEQLRTLAEEIARIGGAALAHPGDLREPETAEALVAATVERFAAIDVLVNNAGATVRGDFLGLRDDDWYDGFALKFFGAMRVTRAAWPHLVRRRGAVVNIAGIGGLTGDAEFAIGGAVNAALMNLTKVLADRGVDDGVRVNAINPGLIRTDRLVLRIARYGAEAGIAAEEAERRMTADAGVARFGEPEEVADLVAFLAAPRAGYIQGAVIEVDGGLTRTL